LLAGSNMPSGEGVPISDPRVLDDSLRLFLGYLRRPPGGHAGARISHA